MSLFKHVSPVGTRLGNIHVSALNNVTQIRTATKRVSGSKTNKNDSAGRRLGPKAYEGHLVKPGQIIMRQRGTKIHPGENVDIGKDHTIFAIEPGYVRFYLDPFHPLRKYVGVALKKELSLPTPHFEPRVRRFGYEEIADPEEAEKEESHMSRKEWLQQDGLKQIAEAKEQENKAALANYEAALAELGLGLNESDSKLAAARLLNIHQLLKVGETHAAAANQATYTYVHGLKTRVNRNEIRADDAADLKKHYLAFSADFDQKAAIDELGKVHKALTESERASTRAESIQKLKTFVDKLISKDDKQTIERLIGAPGIFTMAEQKNLSTTYLPAVLPVSVPGTTVEIADPKKPPKGVTVVRVFDEESKLVRVVGRTKESFLQ